MNAKPAPYQRIIRVATALLLLLWVITTVPALAGMGDWVRVAMLALATSITLLVALEVYQLVKRQRAGHLFLLRTISFYTNFGLAALFLGLLIAEGMGLRAVAGGWSAVLLGGAVFLGVWSQTYPYVYLDSVRLTHRMGITTITFPLFGIKEVQEQGDALLIRNDDGFEVMIFRSSLPANQYATIRERLLNN